jgi:hypothetical protein
VQGTYCDGWRRCACLDAKTRVLAVGVLASTTCNNFIADLLFLSEVSHSLLVAGARGPLRTPLFGEIGPDAPRAKPSSAKASGCHCHSLLGPPIPKKKQAPPKCLLQRAGRPSGPVAAVSVLVLNKADLRPGYVFEFLRCLLVL